MAAAAKPMHEGLRDDSDPVEFVKLFVRALKKSGS